MTFAARLPLLVLAAGARIVWGGAAVLAVLAVGSVLGTYPEPSPDPTPTPIASATPTSTATGTPTPTPTVTPAPTPGAGTANIWIVDGGGSCDGGRSSTPISYADSASPDRRCGTFDLGWDALNAGDAARIAPGTFQTGQRVTGDKASETYLIGDSGVYVDVGTSNAVGCVSSWSAVCLEGQNLTLENVTTITGDPGPNGGLAIFGADITIRDVSLWGDESPDGYYAPSIGVNAAGFTWDGGNLGRPGQTSTALCSHSTVEPIWLFSGGDNATIDGVTVWPYTPKVQAGVFCGGDNTPHIETIRGEDADNFTLKNSHLKGGGDHGSGHIFSSSDPDNWKIINNRIEPRGINAWIQFNGSTANDWLFAYNTVTETGGAALPTGTVLVGNYGRPIACGTTNIKNVWTGVGSCGTNTYIGSTPLGLDADLIPAPSAPAINAAETPGPSDYCTGADVASLDALGNPRPAGSACDAGAIEPPEG